MNDDDGGWRWILGRATAFFLATILSGCVGSAPFATDPLRFDIMPATSTVSLPTGEIIVPTLDGGRRVVRSGDGVIWVVESGAGVISRWSKAGKPLGQLGRRGTDQDQFIDPVDIDVASGLFVSVADVSGRVLRFGREGAFAGSITLPANWQAYDARSDGFRERTSPGTLAASGFVPSAIAETEEGRLVVLDAAAGIVVLSDRVFERFDVMARLEGPPEPIIPVLSAGDGLIVLMEPTQNMIRLFNYSGRETERWTVSLEGVRSIQYAFDSVWLLFPDRIVRLIPDALEPDSKAPFARAYSFSQSGDWVDFVTEPDGVLLLTEAGLRRLDFSF